MRYTDEQHPYSPRDLSIPHYKQNVNGLGELLGIFFAIVAVVLVCTWMCTKRKPTGVRLKLCWFIVCGFIHCILEGYFSIFHASLAGQDTYLAQMWKEYGKGDSRYIVSDPFTVAMESITAFVDGPLCFLTAIAYFGNNQLRPYRYVFQLMVSLFQLYGDSLYFFTEILEGFKHGEIWHPLHFWFYFLFLNSFWIIVPCINILDAARHLARAQKQSDGSGERTQVHTKSKKFR